MVTAVFAMLNVALTSALAMSMPALRPRAVTVMYATGDETTISGYLSALEAKASTLAARAGRPVPMRCVGDACLPLSEYISLLEKSVSDLENADAAVGMSEWAPAVDEEQDGTLSSYLSQLESRTYALCDEFAVARPQRCDEEQCLDLQSYIALLEDTASALEQQQGAAEGMDDAGLSLTAYLAKLEAKVAALNEQLGAAAPARCVGDACLDLLSYVELLEETAATLEAQWETQQGSSW